MLSAVFHAFRFLSFVWWAVHEEIMKLEFALLIYAWLIYAWWIIILRWMFVAPLMETVLQSLIFIQLYLNIVYLWCRNEQILVLQ